MEKELQPDRQIAPLFDWNEIKDNKNLPYPYIVSFTSRTDNDYMWKKYAKRMGWLWQLTIHNMCRFLMLP